MLALMIGAVAIAAFVVGFLLRGLGARTELAAARNELAQARAESAARAGFEALAMGREKTIAQLNANCVELRTEVGAKTDALTQAAKTVAELDKELEAERKGIAEKIALLDKAERSLADKFQSLAGDILEKKSQSFSESSQKEMGNLLNPLKTQIEEFRKKVEEAQTDSKTGVATLQGLIGGLSTLNQQLAEQARNLTTALRGSAKAQGDWGEFILRDLLEKAGLREGVQFSFQETFTGVETEDGAKTKSLRTDVIIRLPGERDLIIDSKVSLNAYTNFANAATDADRSNALKEHLASVRGHVERLTKTGYHHLPGLKTPDFVVMFVPVEPAFLLALQNDAALWADAYQRGILLVGPTTLLYIIRIVNVLWQQEAQARNVKEVMDRGARLYEKFVGFVNDMETIGKGLRDASRSYEDARSKLCSGPGNLVKQVEMLRLLGVKASKSIPAKLLEAADMEASSLALTPEAEDGARA